MYLKFYECSISMHIKNACNQLDTGLINSKTLKVFFSFHFQLQIPLHMLTDSVKQGCAVSLCGLCTTYFKLGINQKKICISCEPLFSALSAPLK